MTAHESDHRLLNDLTLPLPAGKEALPLDMESGSWLGRCASVARVGTMRDADALAALLEDQHAIAQAFKAKLYWPGRRGEHDHDGGPMLSAARAVLDVVCSIRDPATAQTRLRDAKARWHRACVLPVPLPAADAGTASPQTVRDVLAVLADDPAAGYARLMVAALSGDLPESSHPRVHVAVVFGGSADGEHGKLTLAVQKSGPPGLHPDPRLMAFLAADNEFAESLSVAWRTAPKGVRAKCVVWDISDDERPILRIEGASLGAAFGVGLADLSRASKRFGAARVRRLSPRCAITGGLLPDGGLSSVTHYEEKYAATAAQHWRIVVPKGDPNAVRHAEIKIRISYARDLRAAIRKSRLFQTWPHGGIALAVALVLGLTAAALVATSFRNQAHHNALLETASRVANEAASMSSGDSDGTALLLAMASDDIARLAGQRTDVFDQLSQSDATLVKIIRPPSGAYTDAAISGNGRYALIATGAGLYQIVSAETGAVVYSRAYPPGASFLATQTYVTAYAFAPGDSEAAVVTSDRAITLLRRVKDDDWSPSRTLRLPVPVKLDPATGFEQNIATSVSFSPDGKSLLAFGDTIGSYRYRLSGASATVTHCTDPDGTLDVEATDTGEAVLTSRTAATQSANCTTGARFSPPDGATFQAISVTSSNAINAVATAGAEIISIQQSGSSEILSSGGPYSNIEITATTDGPIVTAASSERTIGWSVKSNAEVFTMGSPGLAVAALTHVVWLHDGIAEIHSTAQSAFNSLFQLQDPDALEVGWARDNLVINDYYTIYALIGPHEGYRSVAKTLPMPRPGHYSAHFVITAGSRPYAAAIACPATAELVCTAPLEVYVWNVQDQRPINIPQIVGAWPITAVFYRNELIVSYNNRTLRAYAGSGNNWHVVKQSVLPVVCYSISGRATTGQLDALAAPNPAVSPEVVALDPDTLLVVKRTALAGRLVSGALSVLSDGQVAVAYGGGSMVFLNAQLQLQGATPTGHFGDLPTVTQLPMSEVLVTGVSSIPPTTAVYDASSYGLLSTGPWGRAGDVISAAESPNGDLLATITYDTATIAIWDESPDDLRKRACLAVGRNLSRAEWAQYVGPAVPYENECGAYIRLSLARDTSQAIV